MCPAYRVTFYNHILQSVHYGESGPHLILFIIMVDFTYTGILIQKTDIGEKNFQT
jgi:hypothetical protein